MHNFAKTFCTAWGGGWWISVPEQHRALKAQCQRLTRLSYAFAWIADLSLMLLGGALKRKERLSARLADALSFLYMSMSVLHYVDQHGENNSDELVHAKWALEYGLYQAQKAMLDFVAHFPNRFVRYVVRWVAFPFGQTTRRPHDVDDHHLAQLMMQPNAYRETIKQSMYLSGDSIQPLDKIENAWALLIKHQTSYKKFGRLQYATFEDLEAQLQAKVVSGCITIDDKDDILISEKARWDAIQVDEFAPDMVHAQRG
jgi:acyl-CoA dehydrogenase